VASEVALRFYLTIGFIAWLGLAALAATSTDAMIRRLGPRWKTLHSLVYGVAALALLHFMIQAKADVSEPVMMTGLFLILMLFRVLAKRGAPAWGAALAAALVSPVLTALIEAAWYALVRHIDFWEVLDANIDPDMTFRPSAYVAAAGVVFLAVVLARRSPAPRRSGVIATPSVSASRVRT
jgi:methionine sulfoxide reductase heme-binding subunit